MSVIPFEPEQLNNDYTRYKLYQGWLVENIRRGMLVFVSDPHHGWEVKNIDNSSKKE